MGGVADFEVKVTTKSPTSKRNRTKIIQVDNIFDFQIIKQLAKNDEKLLNN